MIHACSKCFARIPASYTGQKLIDWIRKHYADNHPGIGIRYRTVATLEDLEIEKANA